MQCDFKHFSVHININVDRQSSWSGWKSVSFHSCECWSSHHLVKSDAKLPSNSVPYERINNSGVLPWILTIIVTIKGSSMLLKSDMFGKGNYLLTVLLVQNLTHMGKEKFFLNPITIMVWFRSDTVKHIGLSGGNICQSNIETVLSY